MRPKKAIYIAYIVGALLISLAVGIDRLSLGVFVLGSSTILLGVFFNSELEKAAIIPKSKIQEWEPMGEEPPRIAMLKDGKEIYLEDPRKR